LSKQELASRSSTDSASHSMELQTIMQKMVEDGVYTISPKIDTSKISYPLVASAFPKKTDSEIKAFLDRLVSTKILVPKLLDKIIVCPTCKSSSVYSKYNCPRCSSFDIGKASIIEHVRCGYTGSKERFVREESLVCPKCKGIVSEVDYKTIGTSFECNSCRSRFEAPRMSHKCYSCEDVFTYREARYEPVLEFSLAEDTKRTLAKGSVPIASVAKVLRDNGYEVSVKADLVGKSGAVHTFDICARRNAQLIVANFTFEPKEEDIIGLFAKKYDIDPTLTILVALTPPSKEQDAVSKAYGVKILSSGNFDSIGQEIVQLALAGH
jgi:Thaumarchaeal output domain 1